MKPKADGKKKSYHAPRLVAYGDFRTLTRAKGGSANDGGGKPVTKSSGPPSG